MAGSGGKGGGVAANPVPKNHSMPQTQGGISQNGVQGYHDPQGNFVPYGGAAPMNVNTGDMSHITTPNLAPTQAMPQPGFNVNNAAASGLQDAFDGTRRAIGNTGMFTNYVTDRTLADLERQRQMQQNQMGAQATRAGAFGGSRHGVAEALTNEAFARQGADAFGNLQLGQQQAQMSGAAQLGQLGQQAFNTGRTINQDLMAQGLLQQSLQQALIDAGRGDFNNYAQAPINSLNVPLAALGVAPQPQSQTTTNNPGILGTLGALKYVGVL